MATEATDRTKPADPAGGAELPDAELEVLACLWQRGEATARQVREAMDEYRPMTHGSMVTLLKRLEAKGWVARRKGPVGKAFIYRPTERPGPTRKRLLNKLLDRIFAGNGVALVSTLFDTKPPTPRELQRLETLLGEMKDKAGQ